jgi:hypothetical protein
MHYLELIILILVPIFCAAFFSGTKLDNFLITITDVSSNHIEELELQVIPS